MESWDDARYFLAVCRAGTFTAAARALGVEQSTVSRRVAALEVGLGQRVFERAGSALTLTALGEALIPHAEQLEAQVVAMRTLADGQARGVEGLVRVATTAALAEWLVTPCLMEVMAAHEGLSVQVLTGVHTLELARLEADIALRFARPKAGELVARKAGELETCVVAHRDYVASVGGELERASWIVVEPEAGPRPEAAFVRARLSKRARWQTNDYALQVEWLRQGLGAAVVPSLLTQRFEELVCWPGARLPEPAPVLELFLVTPKTLRSLPRIDVVWRALERGLARWLGAGASQSA